MLNKDQALSLARKYIEDHPYLPENLVVDESLTIEKDYGWVFFYCTKEYLHTKDSKHSLVGAGPIIVEKSDGSITSFGSHKSPDQLTDEYEKSKKYKS